jgi:hypothetical protein
MRTVGVSSPIHSHSGVAPASTALSTRLCSSSLRALKQIGQTRSSPPAAAYCSNSLARGGQPSQATASAKPSSASRTASFVRKKVTFLPLSAAAPPTRNAIITRSASSSPVARLTTTLPAMRSS